MAFTYRGLDALGVPQDSLETFAPEFQQGMAARAVDLGDVGDSGPANIGSARSAPVTCTSHWRCSHRTLPGLVTIWLEPGSRGSGGSCPAWR